MYCHLNTLSSAINKNSVVAAKPCYRKGDYKGLSEFLMAIKRRGINCLRVLILINVSVFYGRL
jgi:hypothetical protein